MAEAYPTFLAGQRITATLLSSMQPMVARKTSDTARSATTTLAADPHLTFELAASAVYIMDGWVKYDSPTAADINIDWTVPSGTLGEWAAVGLGHSPVVGASGAPALQTDTQDARGYLIRLETNDISQPRSYGGLGVSGGGITPMTFHLKGTIRTSTTPGTYAMEWAQLTSNATATTVYTDSWLRLLRVA